eukprot:CAMPEP_0118966644 /NCGR_PEP_ID=MMETSP1173-20130426/4091_1 /TAXON_ID=1034831 /ORGANISM="Rhizochromulina marina cf, Strain CCMP1243" /LENGTH=1179 /DNA_ID=CAMNT_0006915457 /DNA_START=13 /DNA_END=3552 /DNA_ORIENTATION=+
MVGDVQAGDVDWGDQDSFVMRVKEPMDGSMNIRVVLKVRPPNEREKALPGGICVDVSNYREVKIGDREPFTFDVAFPMEVTQLEVFDRIGVDIVKTAYNGYNASMFAYGQTSSGKSFSMMGIRGTSLVGLIPRIADLLFHVAEQSPEREFFVEASYLEIYNERVRDLLDVDATDGLKIRESKQHGVHVVGLTKLAVADMDETMHLLDTGTSNRTVAATRYNTESSRSHSVFEMSVQQKYRDPTTGEEMQSKTKIALIDLAGSERSDRVGSTGKTLKEGNNINKSLTVLGRCIKALVEIAKSGGKHKKVVVPFRESVLTFYLRESLAGNSRTTMLATVSPASSNIDESLSTLRYADSAKAIKTAAIKSEDPLKAKVRELTAEVERLRLQLVGKPAEGGKKVATFADLSEEEKKKYLEELEVEMRLLGKDGYADAQRQAYVVKARQVSPRETFPQLSCLNKDELLSHAMKVPLTSKVFTIGRSNGSVQNDFMIDGMGIQDVHCEITQGDAGTTIRAMTEAAITHVNGLPLQPGENTPLNHLDRIILGPCRLLALYLERPMTAEDRARWNYANSFRELISGDTEAERMLMSPARRALLDRLGEIEGILLRQANTIANEMCTNIKFISQVMIGDSGLDLASTTVDEFITNNDYRVKVTCLVTSKQRLQTMQDLNQSFIRFRKQAAGTAVDELEKDEDEDDEDDMLKGLDFTRTSHVELDVESPDEPPIMSPEVSLENGRKALNSPPAGARGAAAEDDWSGELSDEQASAAAAKALAQLGGGDDGWEDAGATVVNSAPPTRGSGVQSKRKRPSLFALSNPMRRKSARSLEVTAETELFSIDADDFEIILAELKDTHTHLTALTGGLAVASDSDKGISSMVKTIFDAVDTDQSGAIDKFELKAAINKFNTENDEQFFERVLKAEGFPEDFELTYPEFEEFLIKFLQQQFYAKIDAYVTNRTLFASIGGRVMSRSGTVLWDSPSVNLDELDLDDLASRRGSAMQSRDSVTSAQQPQKRPSKAAKAARKAKLSKEAKRARMRQRMMENAVMTNFITTLKSDITSAVAEIEETASGKDKKRQKAGRRKHKSQQDILSKLNTLLLQAVKDLEGHYKTAQAGSKERDQLEDFLARMLAEREAFSGLNVGIDEGIEEEKNDEDEADVGFGDFVASVQQGDAKAKKKKEAAL